MRATWWVGLMTIAAAAPFAAHADNQATKTYDPTRAHDLWDTGRLGEPVERMWDISLLPLTVQSQSDSTATVVHAPSAIRAVDTYMSRGFGASGKVAGKVASTTVGGGGSVAAPTRGALTSSTSTTPPATTAAPEMNTGLAAATGLTLLFGGVAILRGRRLTRENG